MAVAGSALKQRVYHGFREYLVITAYLWVVFALFDIYKSVLVAQYHISLAAKSLAIINALALGKDRVDRKRAEIRRPSPS